MAAASGPATTAEPENIPSPSAGSSEKPEPVRANAPASPAKVADGDWHGLVEAMNIRGMVKQLAVHCVLQGRNGNEVELMLNEEFSQLLNPGLESKLQDALSDYLGERIKLTIKQGSLESESPAQTAARNAAERQQQAEHAIDQDPVVQALKENFGAEVVPNSVRPID